VKSLEHWVLRVADCDAMWFGFGWLRPAKHQHIGLGYISLSSVLLGLPGVAVGAGLIYWFQGRVEPRVWLGMLGLVLLVELPLHLLFARYWNCRAAELSITNP